MAGPSDANVGKSKKDAGDSDLKNLQAKTSENLSTQAQDLLKDQSTEKLAERKADQPSTNELDDKEKARLAAIAEVAKTHGATLESAKIASFVSASQQALSNPENKAQMLAARQQNDQVVKGLKDFQAAGGKFHDAELEEMVKRA